jgi:hypothetical protein
MFALFTMNGFWAATVGSIVFWRREMNRRFSVLAAAVAMTLSAGSIYAAEGNPIVFTPPAATPQGGNGTVGIFEVTNNGPIGDQDAARASLNNVGAGATTNAYSTARINFGPNDGHFYAANGGGNIPNESFHNGQANDISMTAQGYINIPVAGTYTFGVNSDDGFTLAFPGHAFDGVTLPSTDAANPAKLQTYNGVTNGAFQFYGGRGNQDSLAAITLPAGPVPVQLTFHQGGGGYGVELFATPGSKTGFDNTFNLVGQGAIAAAPKVTEPRAKGLGGLDVSSFTYTEIHGIAPDTVTQVLAQYNANQGTTSQQTTINFVDPDNANSGNHNPTANFPGDLPGNDDHFGAVAKTTLTVDAAHAGKYTFVVYSDDGYLLNITNKTTNQLVSLARSDNSDVADRDGINGNDSLFHDANCCTDRLGVWQLDQGSYTLESAFEENGGGAGFYLFGAQGDVPLRQADGSFNPQFVLIGDTSTGNVDFVTQDAQIARDAGLQFVAAPEPGSIALIGLGALGVLVRRRRK